MPEETKEEYIARHRKEMGVIDPDVIEIPEKKAVSLKERLNSIFFLVLFAVFLWVILQIFGMMKSN